MFVACFARYGRYAVRRRLPLRRGVRDQGDENQPTGGSPLIPQQTSEIGYLAGILLADLARQIPTCVNSRHREP